MGWKRWCHARKEGRGCELSCEPEPGRDSAAASLLFACGETDRLKTAGGHNGLASERSLTHWTFDEHGIQGELGSRLWRGTLAVCFCPPFRLWLKKRTVILGDRRCRKRRQRDKGYMHNRVLPMHWIAWQLLQRVPFFNILHFFFLAFYLDMRFGAVGLRFGM